MTLTDLEIGLEGEAQLGKQSEKEGKVKVEIPLINYVEWERRERIEI